MKKDELFLVTYGEYSTYKIVALCRALKDFDLLEVQKEYTNLSIMHKQDFNSASVGKFITWLTVDTGLSVELSCTELHMGYYGKFELSACLFSATEKLFD